MVITNIVYAIFRNIPLIVRDDMPRE